jgi:hypothetical protein
VSTHQGPRRSQISCSPSNGLRGGNDGNKSWELAVEDERGKKPREDKEKKGGGGGGGGWGGEGRGKGRGEGRGASHEVPQLG